MAIRASGLSYKSLAAYFTEGITWSRLSDLATNAKEFGGLALFKLHGKRWKEICGTAPGAIIDNRPETDLQFLQFLTDCDGKEAVLHRLATKDTSLLKHLCVLCLSPYALPSVSVFGCVCEGVGGRAREFRHRPMHLRLLVAALGKTFWYW